MFGIALQFVLYLFLLDLGGIYAKQVQFGDTSNCPSVWLPVNGQRQDNVLYKTKPMFVLDDRSVKEGYLPGKSYSLHVNAQDSDRKFSDVLVWAEGSGLQGCSTGSFDTNPTYYHQPENCSHLVSRNSKLPGHTFLFTWTAPLCGCITIRARVSIADTGSFVLDDKSTKDGYLTSQICPKDVHPMLSTLSLREKEDLLCRVVSDITGSDIATRQDVLKRRKMEYNAMSQLQKEAWEIALGQRVYNTKKCCGLTGSERSECLGDDRRHRVDRFCAYGESVIPFTIKRRAFMDKRREECCWKLGERRYHCFAYVPTQQANNPNSLWNVKHVQEMDESDPINDLEDYAPEVLKELSKLPAFMNAYADSATLEVNLSTEEQHQKDLKVSKETKPVSSKETTNLLTTTATTKARVVQTTTESPTTVFVTTTDMEESKKTTDTSKDLQRKMRKLKLRLDCCESGRQTAEDVEEDPWGKCTTASYKYTRKMRGGRRMCRTYFLKCCIEESQSEEENSGHQDDDDEDDDIDDEDTSMVNSEESGDYSDAGDGSNEDNDDSDFKTTKSVSRINRRKLNRRKNSLRGRRRGRKRSSIKRKRG